MKEKNFELAIKELEKAISCANNPKDKVGAYYTLSEIFLEQGKSDLAAQVIEDALKYEPNNLSFQRRLQVVTLGTNETPEEMKVFDKLLYYDLDCIAEIAKNHGIKLILLSYPNVAYRNEIRKQIADKHNIPFIDISSIFTDLLTKCNYKDLFSDDGSHPNANGYRVIAESIYRVINSI
jgi:lysophospholipase L1-like esterase